MHAGFGDQIDRAIKYSEDRDPRRARSVLTYLDTMINHGPAGVGGLYIFGTNVCYVNYAAYRVKSPTRARFRHASRKY